MDSEEACEVIDRIRSHFGIDRTFEGEYESMTPYWILVATIISQQTSERNSRKAYEKLRAECGCMDDVLASGEPRIDNLIFSSRFHAQKSSAICRCTEIIKNGLNGNVPDTLEGLIALPGVGEKTAACVLRYGFGKRSAIVDVHIARVASRIGFSDSPKPCDVKRALERIVPEDRWDDMDIAFITLGREMCRPKNPSCDECPVKGLCRFARKFSVD